MPLLYGQWAYHLTRGEHKLALSLTEQFDKFRQGCLYYQFIPTMQEARLRPLMEKFGQLLLEQSLFEGRDTAGKVLEPVQFTLFKKRRALGKQAASD